MEQTIFIDHALLCPRSLVLLEDFLDNMGAITCVVVSVRQNLCDVSKAESDNTIESGLPEIDCNQ